MLSVAVMRSTRYDDIPSSSDVATNEHDDAPRVAGDVERRLPGRVGGADDVDVVALARLALRRRVAP